MPESLPPAEVVNAESKQHSNKENQVPGSLEYHRSVLESRVHEGKYVVPLEAPVAELLHQHGGDQRALTAKDISADPKRLVNRMQQTYISPSDTIMSPATQKLAAFKNKHMGKGWESRPDAECGSWKSLMKKQLETTDIVYEDGDKPG